VKGKGVGVVVFIGGKKGERRGHPTFGERRGHPTFGERRGRPIFCEERRGHPTFGRKKGPEKEGAAQLFVKEGGCERRGL
jgi:hypothetical protein